MIDKIMSYVANNNKTVKACGLFLLVNLFWGASFPFTKIALESVSYFYLIAFRFLIATLFFILLFAKRLKNIDKVILKKGFFLAAMMTLSILLQTVGVDKTTSSKASFYTGFAVLFTPLLMMIGTLRLPSSKTFLSMFVAIVGLLLFASTGDTLSFSSFFNILNNFNTGDLICLVGSIFFSLQIIFTGKFVADSDVILLTLVQAMFCTLFSFIAAIIIEPIPTAISGTSWACLVFLGVFCTALAYWIQNRVQKDLSASNTAMISVMEPVFGAVLSCMILGEVLSTVSKVGAVLITVAMLWSQDGDSEEEKIAVEGKLADVSN